MQEKKAFCDKEWVKMRYFLFIKAAKFVAIISVLDVRNLSGNSFEVLG